MASISEEPVFKLCGLCGSFSQDAVELKTQMRKFLVHLLNLNKTDVNNSNEFESIPPKICSDCYQECVDAQRFKEKCLKTIAKINDKEGKPIPKSWIIGWSSEKSKQIESNTEAEKVLQEKSIEKAPKQLESNPEAEKALKEKSIAKAPKQIASEGDNAETSRAPRSKTKLKKDYPANNQQPVEKEEDKEIAETSNVKAIEDCLKAQPVVKISWNERNLGEMILKQCDVKVKSMKSPDIMKMATKITPKTHKVISTLHPRIQKASSQARDNSIPGIHTRKATNSLVTNENGLSNKNNQKRKFKKHLVRFKNRPTKMNVSNNGRIEYSKTADQEAQCKESESPHRKELGAFAINTNEITSKENKEEKPLSTLSNSSKASRKANTSKDISPESVVRHSSFGRNIRTPSDQSNSLWETSSRKRQRRQLNSGLDTSMSSPKVCLSKLHQDATHQKATPKLNLNSSPKISLQAPNEDATSTLNKSASRSSPRRKEQTTKLLPLVERLNDRSFNPSIILDPLTSSTEGALNGIEPAANEDLDESYPENGPYQCELCQNITDSKEHFVAHIKTQHVEDVDDDVLNTLYGDLRKARRKKQLAELEKSTKRHTSQYDKFLDLPLVTPTSCNGAFT